MVKDPDGDLVRQSQRGNKRAYGELVNRYYEMVYTLAFGVLREREASRDVAQNVFMKVFGEISKFQRNSKFKTWLYRIAVNAAIDEGRKRKPVISLDKTDHADDESGKPMDVVASGPGPRECASQSELREAVAAALAEMSEEHRAVLTLREWQGLSYDEIAEALDISVGTVMSRLFYARKKLAEILGMQHEEYQK
ncbi:MAG: sigma-70 family RNA polymerase sigma factor [Candidatus Omnitrophota bacterium]|nr:sigma-70 family RNA polymerase sigma factor [Candidatus Omnitrophota bacterium]